MASARALFLFDIDGTLVRRSGPQHRRVLEDAVRIVTGYETTTEGIPLQGMLDRAILSEMLARAGAPAGLIRRSMPALVSHAQRLYLRAGVPPLHDKVCPGVRPFLRKLDRRGIPAALVTGNLSRIGWHKVERAGLRRYFRFGAFAEQAEERAGLARIAIMRARARGWVSPSTPVWLIGDHPNDVNAAKANGIGSIGVATGLATEAELREARPDRLIQDLRDLSLEELFG